MSKGGHGSGSKKGGGGVLGTGQVKKGGGVVFTAAHTCTGHICECRPPGVDHHDHI